MSERETVWVGVRQSYDHESTDLFKDRERAYAWLKMQWYRERRDAAMSFWFALDYWGEEHPDVPIVTEITEGHRDFAEFSVREMGDRYFIQERELT